MSRFAPQIKIPATHMRGGTSKGVFFKLQDLPEAAQQPGPARDALLLRVLGSPDPYGKQIDGLGNASSSTSKAVILSKSTRSGHDVDYLFGQVAIDKPFVDWSGNCGNLSAAVGPCAIHMGLIDAARITRSGTATIRIWQANIGKTIVAHVPMTEGLVQETGDFELDGVAFAAAEVALEFIDPADEGEGEQGSAMFPTGNVVDELDVPGVGHFAATLINAGIPTIFLNANDLGYTGTELQGAINTDPQALARFEALRAHGALRMGLIQNLSEAAKRQHTPKIAFVAPPASYTASSGKHIKAGDIDLLVRALSMGQLHHAMMGTAAVAIGVAAAIPGTLVNLAAGSERGKDGVPRQSVRFGHPSGTLRVGAEAAQAGGQWQVTKALMSRSARVLMEGWVRVPGDVAEI
ncbi:MAG: 2-methylaconitate cis-trans isomerase PrpF [Giesbergeria sp.]|jgi:probable AcnD-accessory protein PrpF|nr:2-methylaconitate cis-trans isomerase PrpF [Giesbergeria sp.]MBP6158920.1 2-methylaconitate cis-trans isomerase PrpF [Giesbergeria sp.]MBP7083590.1 2-methylaconitate cis-trans isomerase PrpF [Giesbergeria sp.]MBP9785131.1 2-methylaconitate cis-trans isomerase PrpF [Giesbergeria sp.]